jgi:hypothetical protein
VHGKWSYMELAIYGDNFHVRRSNLWDGLVMSASSFKDMHDFYFIIPQATSKLFMLPLMWMLRKFFQNLSSLSFT